jgi:hypothetical protein
VEQYNRDIAENPKVELIHISHDRDEDAAEEWAVKEGFPWLTVLPDDVERSDLLDYKIANSVPHYILVDAAGNRLADGSSAVFSKVKSLTAGE